MPTPEEIQVDPNESVLTPIEGMTEQVSTALPEKLEGDTIPEAFKGKSLNDVFAEVTKLQNTATINAEVMRRMAATPAAPQVVHMGQPAPVAGSQQIGPTEEQLEEMVASDDPKQRIAAMRIMQAQNNNALGAALERRLAPLAMGTVSSAEANARSKYALEFELFSKEIESYRSRVPAEAFTNPQAWDELIFQVRGSDPQKYVNELQRRGKITPTLDDAREAERALAGSALPVRLPGSPNGAGSPHTLDALQRKVAEEFGMTDAEYIHFSKQGAQL